MDQGGESGVTCETIVRGKFVEVANYSWRGATWLRGAERGCKGFNNVSKLGDILWSCVVEAGAKTMGDRERIYRGGW
jgi:hypothetical protein